MTSGRHRLLLVAVGVAFSGVFLWLALRGTDVRKIWESLRGADFWLAIPLIIVLGLSYWAKALRWRILLRPVCKTTGREVFPVVIIGYAANLALPAQLGELVRMYVASRKLGVEKTPVLGTILLERMFDFLTVLALFGLSSTASDQSPPKLESVAYFIGGAGALILSVCIAYARWTDSFISIVTRMTSFLPDRIQATLVEQMELARTGLGVMRNPRLFLAAAAISAVQWLLMGVCFYLSTLAVGINVPITAGFIVVAFTMAGLTLPSSPGSLGTIQLGFVLALMPFGVHSGDAVAASVFWHVLAYVSVAVVGLFYLLRSGYSLTEMRESIETSKD